LLDSSAQRFGNDKRSKNGDARNIPVSKASSNTRQDAGFCFEGLLKVPERNDGKEAKTKFTKNKRIF
jgi:hypothetical protein